MNNNNGNGGVAWAMDTVLSPYVQIPLTEFCNEECIERNLDRGLWKVNVDGVRKTVSKWLGIDTMENPSNGSRQTTASFLMWLCVLLLAT